MKTFEVIRLGHQGDGICEGPLLASRTLPGEVVTGLRAGNRLEDVRIVTPSPNRVTPPCRHFRACGGCQLQHASAEFQESWKTAMVEEALRRAGLTADFAPAHVSPERSRRRAKFTARRTRNGAIAGFLGRRSEVIADIPECRLLDPGLMPAIPLAVALAGRAASRKQALAVTATLSAAGLDVAVTDGKPLERALQATLADIAEQFQLARLSWQGEIVVQRHAPEQAFDGIAVLPPPGAFLQATPDGEDTLRAEVRRIVGDARNVADLFAGCGTFALPLSRGAAVHAVEGDAAMLAALQAGWRRAPGLRQISCEIRDLFRNPLIREELRRFDAAVIDPPRAGAERQIREMAGAGIARIAYVSCNPATFARDARILVAAGYDLGSVRVVDQFRWSAHVELVAGFSFTSA